MARDPRAALVALNRFGYGARGAAAGDLLNAASDPRGFVKADLERPAGALLEHSGLASTPTLARTLFDYQDEVRRQREAKADKPPPTAPQAKEPPQPPNVVQSTYRAEALARFQRATSAEVGLVERLVAFWSNHFCISAQKGPAARIWAGAFEREAIRPHVLGRFADMLRAVEQLLPRQ
jgi:uncharacterized protein (DUF1800 family)